MYSLESVPDWIVWFPPGTVEVGPVLRDTSEFFHWQSRIWNIEIILEIESGTVGFGPVLGHTSEFFQWQS
jgi:hypothetical protein